MAIPVGTHIFRHNQNTYAPSTVMARGEAVWFAPAGITYHAPPRARGIYSPGRSDVTMLYAKTPAANTSNPRLFGKRLVQTKLYRTIFN